MPQQTLHIARLTLMPLPDEHLEWEVELDSDAEVMRYLIGRASSSEEVEASHARRMTAAQKVDGLGFGAVGGLKRPPADELVVDEPNPTPEQWERRAT